MSSSTAYVKLAQAKTLLATATAKKAPALQKKIAALEEQVKKHEATVARQAAKVAEKQTKAERKRAAQDAAALLKQNLQGIQGAAKLQLAEIKAEKQIEHARAGEAVTQATGESKVQTAIQKGLGLVAKAATTAKIQATRLDAAQEAGAVVGETPAAGGVSPVVMVAAAGAAVLLVVVLLKRKR